VPIIAAMDNSPTALFDSYEQDFQQIVDSIKAKLDGDGKEEHGGKHQLPTIFRN
jgi:vesicle transport through interaction with t-SNAREs protein 1